MQRIAKSLGIVGVLAFCLPASAAPIVQTLPFGGTPNFTETLTFNQFDDLGGTLTLQSIEVIFSLDVQGGSLTLDNDGVNGASGNFEFGAKGDLSSGDVSLLDGAFQPVTAELDSIHQGPFNLAGNVGDGAGDYDPAGPDGMLYNGGLENDSDSGFINSTLFAPYIGVSTYDIDVNVDQWSDYGGVSGVEYAVTPVSASGEVTVIYNFVPEPATLAMLAVGGLFVVRRRR